MHSLKLTSWSSSLPPEQKTIQEASGVHTFSTSHKFVLQKLCSQAKQHHRLQHIYTVYVVYLPLYALCYLGQTPTMDRIGKAAKTRASWVCFSWKTYLSPFTTNFFDRHKKQAQKAKHRRLTITRTRLNVNLLCLSQSRWLIFRKPWHISFYRHCNVDAGFIMANETYRNNRS